MSHKNLFIPCRIRRIRFLNTILDCGGCFEGPASIYMAESASVATVEAEDQASETLDPATDALEEQGESKQFPSRLRLALPHPLAERLLGGAVKIN